MLVYCIPYFGRRVARSVASTSPLNPSLSRFAVLSLIALALTMPQAFGQDPGLKAIKTISLGTSPFGIALSPDGQTVWVATGKYSDAGDFVTLIDVKTLETLAKKITVGQYPQEIAFAHRDSRAFVTNSTSSTISVVNTKTNELSQTVNLPGGYPFGIAVSLDDKKVMVTTQGNLGVAMVLDNAASGLKLAGNVPIPGLAGRAAVIPAAPAGSSMAGNMLIPSYDMNTSGPPTLTLVDPAIPKVVKTLTLRGSTSVPQAVVVSPDARFAYVTLFAAGSRSTQLLEAAGGVWVVDLQTFTTARVIETGDARSFGLDITPDGKYLLVTNFVRNEVVAIDTLTNKAVAKVSVGQQPLSVTLSSDGKLAFIANQSDATVSVIAVSRQGLMAASLNR